MLLFAAAIAGAASVATAPVPPLRTQSKSGCPRTTSYLADAGSIYRGGPPAPRKLNQLPPGATYMAVYRRIGGCEAPLTMVEYRNPRRR